MCKYLRKVCFLGCGALKDGGVIGMVRNLPWLEDIDLGSTNISGQTLFEMVSLCLNLRNVNIIGCKKLKSHDDLVLKNNGIGVEAGEDVFRFHLMPDHNSDLPRITHNVLKTRSTLSLHKVYRYLVKKLQEANVEDYLDEEPVEQAIVILCNGVVLETSMQLRSVREQHWSTEERNLTLTYRKKDSLAAPQKPRIRQK